MLSKSWAAKLFSIFFVLSLTACASAPEPVEEQTSEETEVHQGDERDPFESINRTFWTFNYEYADKYVLKPAAQAWSYIPSPVRTGLYNAALNLNEPFSAVNNALQLKFERAGNNLIRFIVNSTMGVAGLMDVAGHAGLHREEEEFGEVLATYGVTDGPYLMLPGLGPTTLRDEAGDFVDKYYWPLAAIDFWPNVARQMVILLEVRTELAQQEAILEESLDPYEFVKNAYFQRIEYRIYDGNPPVVIDEEEEGELDDMLEDY